MPNDILSGRHSSYTCDTCVEVGTITEKALATHSSTLAWKIPWAEEPGRLQSMGSLRVGHDWATSLSLFTFMHWRRKWQPIPLFLPGESQGWEPRGLPSMGSHRVGHDWSDLAAAGTINGLIINSDYAWVYIINITNSDYIWLFLSYICNTGNFFFFFRNQELSYKQIIENKESWDLNELIVHT